VAVSEPLTRRWQAGRPVDVGGSIGGLRRGAGDPTHRALGHGPGRRWLRASRTPMGTVLVSVRSEGQTVVAHAWGDGAEWALDQLPRLFGAGDDPAGFAPLAEHVPLVEAHRRFPDLRIGATDLVMEALAPACLEQVVTGKEAFRAFRMLVRKYGERAPGPARQPDSAA
jgi:3-methyladenine DNA glycosylase/8-oxoguanine DNA glycosylase